MHRPSAIFLWTVAVVMMGLMREARGAQLPPEDPPEPEWDIVPGEEISFACPANYALSHVQSWYDADDTSAQPRYWDFECTKVKDALVTEDNCASEVMSLIQNPMVFRCPKGQYMRSISRGPYFLFTAWLAVCCEIPGVVCPDECFLSEPANEFGEDFCYTADEGSVIVGAVSTYDAATNDRQWRFEECKASKCQLFPGIDLDDKYGDDKNDKPYTY